MSFINKLKKIENDLEDIKNKGEIAQKTNFFRDNIVTFEQRNAKLLKLIDYKNKITSKNIDVSVDKEKFLQIKTNLEKVEQNFSSDPSNESLTQGRFLGNYEKFSDEFLEIFEKDIRTAWRNYVTSKYTKENYYVLNSSIIKSPENKKILQELHIQFNKFNELQKLNDIEDKDFEDAEAVTTELNKLRSQLKEDYHEDVQKFLDEINNKGFATIDLLTEEVVSFITTHNLKNDYVIKRNSND